MNNRVAMFLIGLVTLATAFIAFAREPVTLGAVTVPAPGVVLAASLAVDTVSDPSPVAVTVLEAQDSVAVPVVLTEKLVASPLVGPSISPVISQSQFLDQPAVIALATLGTTDMNPVLSSPSVTLDSKEVQRPAMILAESEFLLVPCWGSGLWLQREQLLEEFVRDGESPGWDKRRRQYEAGLKEVLEAPPGNPEE